MLNPGVSSLPDGWEKGFDQGHGVYYYFNRDTGVSQWHMPTGATAPAPTESPALASVKIAVPVQRSSRDGFYYRDPYGQVQGPFTNEAIQAWRPYLPMDMKVWMLEEEDFLQEEDFQAHKAASQVAAAAVTASCSAEREGPPGGDETLEDGLRDDGITEASCLPAADAASQVQEQDEEAGARGGSGESYDTRQAVPGNEGGGAALQQPCKGGSNSAKKRRHEDSSMTGAAAAAGPYGNLTSLVIAHLMECLPAVELADLTGDTVLLTEWRSQRASGMAPPSPHAPPASIWEHWLLYGPRRATQQPAAAEAAAAAAPTPATEGAASEPMGSDWEPGEDSRLKYAEAVLAGLPPDDEAVLISQLALSAGKSLQDVIDFSYTNSAVAGPAAGLVDFSTAIRNPHSGRLVAAGHDETPQSHSAALYGEMSRWCNPEDMEQSLQDAARRKGQQLPTHVWKKLVERKLEIKKKMRVLAMQ